MKSTATEKRCLNIDWLEVFCLEDPVGWPHDAEYFMRMGYQVVVRDYGTRIYSQMFTVLDADGLPWFEVRRDLCANHIEGARPILPSNAAHIRCSNRTCYFTDTAVMLTKFCEANGYAIQRISRIDLALDFDRFDSGDDVQSFIDRYMNGRYAKINQSKIRAFGTDEWNGRRWNSLSWGSPSSQIGTKLYCKSQELREAKDKPYIRQAWAVCGLVHDMHTLAKLTPDGKTIYPDIWRLEFSIRSSVKNWFVMEDHNGRRKRIRSVRNDLSVYSTKQSQMEVFASLVEHYFHFKHYQPGTVKYKCTDKQLFRFESCREYYECEKPANSTPMNTDLERLRRRLSDFMLTVYTPELKQACEIVLKAVEDRLLHDTAACHFNATELTLLRELISYRLSRRPDEPVNDSLETIHALMNLEGELFGER